MCSFLNTSINLVKCLSSLFFFKCWGYEIGGVGASYLPVSHSSSFLLNFLLTCSFGDAPLASIRLYL